MFKNKLICIYKHSISICVSFIQVMYRPKVMRNMHLYSVAYSPSFRGEATHVGESSTVIRNENLYETARCHITRGIILHRHSCKNTKSRIDNLSSYNSTESVTRNQIRLCKK
jgi:hypothetical protein